MCACAKAVKSPTPQPSDPRRPELKKLLAEDPYEVPTKTKEEKNTRAKNLAI